MATLTEFLSVNNVPTKNTIKALSESKTFEEYQDNYFKKPLPPGGLLVPATLRGTKNFEKEKTKFLKEKTTAEVAQEAEEAREAEAARVKEEADRLERIKEQQRKDKEEREKRSKGKRDMSFHPHEGGPRGGGGKRKSKKARKGRKSKKARKSKKTTTKKR